MKNKWKYSEAENCRVGSMICERCQLEIKHGDYKYAEKSHKFDFLGYFHHQHRDCSMEDTKWREIDSKRNIERGSLKRRLIAYKEFKEKWGTYALDEEIRELKEDLV